MAADLQLRQYSHFHEPPELPYPTAWMGAIDTTDPVFQSLSEASKKAILATQDQSSHSPTPAAVPGPHACRPPDHTSRPASHHLLRQEHLRTQRAAQAAWVAEQAQKISKETTEPSQTSSTSIDPDIVARNPPITDPDNLRNLTPTQFQQDQKAVFRTMQDQSRPPPTPAAVPVPPPRVCPDQNNGPLRPPASERERDFHQGALIRVEWIFFHVLLGMFLEGYMGTSYVNT